MGREGKFSEELPFPFNLQLESNRKCSPLLALASQS